MFDCKLCGSSTAVIGRRGWFQKEYYVYCSRCETRSKPERWRDYAIERWNTLMSMDPVDCTTPLPANLDPLKRLLLTQHSEMIEKLARLEMPKKTQPVKDMKHLVHIKRITDELLKQAKANPDWFRSLVVRWDAVHCASVEYYTADDQTTGIRVWIEKAASEATELRTYLEIELRRRFGDVDVIMEL